MLSKKHKPCWRTKSDMYKNNYIKKMYKLRIYNYVKAIGASNTIFYKN